MHVAASFPHEQRRTENRSRRTPRRGRERCCVPVVRVLHALSERAPTIERGIHTQHLTRPAWHHPSLGRGENLYMSKQLSRTFHRGRLVRDTGRRQRRTRRAPPTDTRDSPNIDRKGAAQSSHAGRVESRRIAETVDSRTDLVMNLRSCALRRQASRRPIRGGNTVWLQEEPGPRAECFGSGTAQDACQKCRYPVVDARCAGRPSAPAEGASQ